MADVIDLASIRLSKAFDSLTDEGTDAALALLRKRLPEGLKFCTLFLRGGEAGQPGQLTMIGDESPVKFLIEIEDPGQLLGVLVKLLTPRGKEK